MPLFGVTGDHWEKLYDSEAPRSESAIPFTRYDYPTPLTF